MKRQVLACAAIAVVTSCFILGGCAALPNVSSLEKLPEASSTQGFTYAVYATPGTFTAGTSDAPHGYVLLVREDGSSERIRTSGMPVGSVEWAGNKLYFNDLFGNYEVTDSGIGRSQSNNVILQSGLHVLSDGSAYAAFSEGYNDDRSYLFRTTHSKGSTAHQVEVDGIYTSTMACGDQIFGLTVASGPLLKTDPKEEFHYLRRLPDASTPQQQLVAKTQSIAMPGVQVTAPCRDGVIYSIDGAKNPEAPNDHVPVISRWDTKKKAYTNTALTLEGDIENPFRHPQNTPPRIDSGSLRGDFIDWHGNGNKIYSTNIHTGKTALKFEVDGHIDDERFSLVRFLPGRILLLKDDDARENIKIIEYDRATGTQLSVTEVKDTAGVRNKNMWYTAITKRS